MAPDLTDGQAETLLAAALRRARQENGNDVLQSGFDYYVMDVMFPQLRAVAVGYIDNAFPDNEFDHQLVRRPNPLQHNLTELERRHR